MSATIDKKAPPVTAEGTLNLLTVDKKDTLATFSSKHVEHTFDTEYGPMKVYVDGDLKNQKKPVMLCYHDIGLNHVTCFQRFFGYIAETGHILSKFNFIFIDAPGQHYDAKTISADVKAFDMEVLSQLISVVLDKFNVRKVHGFGVGAGAYILQTFSIMYPTRIASLILLGGTCRKVGWIEWGRKLMGGYGTHITGQEVWWRDYFLERWFSIDTQNRNKDLVQYYCKELFRVNQDNLWKFIQGFQARKDITKEIKNIRCKVMLAVGDLTMAENETVVILGQLNPKLVEWIRVEDAGILITEEKPDELVKPIKFFCNSLGFYDHMM